MRVSFEILIDMNKSKPEPDYHSRQYSPVDRLISNIDQAIQTIFGSPTGTGRADPAFSAQPANG